MRVRVEGEAGGKDDAAELPSVPVERGAAVVERDRRRHTTMRSTSGKRISDQLLGGERSMSAKH